MKTQAELRSEILKQRRALSSYDRQQRSRRVNDTLLQMLSEQEIRQVGTYMPMKTEVQLNLAASTAKLCFPRVEQELLQFYSTGVDKTQFEKNALSVLEPPLSHSSPAELSEEDVVLVPGVVFSRQGHRIGMGKGFYDRFLATTKAEAWGVAFDFQVIDEEWELHPWDQRVDRLITDTFTLQWN